MIQLTDINGRTHAIHPDAIARLVEPGDTEEEAFIAGGTLYSENLY